MSRIDYDLRKIKAIAFDMDGVLSASTVAVREDGTLQRHSNVKDGYALQLAVRCGLEIAIISGAKDLSMLPAYKSLGLKDIFFHSADKEERMMKWMTDRNLKAEEVAYVGDDIPDIPAMRLVGLPCVPADASIEAKAEALYISPVNGGCGVARDLIAQILTVQGKWMKADCFSW